MFKSLLRAQRSCAWAAANVGSVCGKLQTGIWVRDRPVRKPEVDDFPGRDFKIVWHFMLRKNLLPTPNFQKSVS